MREILSEIRELMLVISEITRNNNPVIIENGSSGWDFFLGIFTGIIIFILSEVLKEVYFQPIQEYKRIKGHISSVLVYYANCYGNVMPSNRVNDLYDEGSKAIRKAASDLASFVEVSSKTKPGIPKRETLKQVVSELIGLSNSFYCPDSRYIHKYLDANEKRVKTIRQLLSINDFENK